MSLFGRWTARSTKMGVTSPKEKKNGSEANKNPWFSNDLWKPGVFAV